MRPCRLCLFGFCLAVLFLGLVLGTARGFESVDVALEDCPEAVQKTLRDEARGGRIDAVTKDTEDGKTLYFADVLLGGKAYEVVVAEDGLLDAFALHVDDHEIGLTDCPDPVQKTLRDEAKGARIRDVSRELNLGVKVYTTEFEVGGKRYKVMVAEDGTLTEKILQIDEDEVALTDCPEGVQRTLKEESRDGMLSEIRRSSGIGKPVYMADLQLKGSNYHLVIFVEGTLVSKTLEGND